MLTKGCSVTGPLSSWISREESVQLRQLHPQPALRPVRSLSGSQGHKSGAPEAARSVTRELSRRLSWNPATIAEGSNSPLPVKSRNHAQTSFIIGMSLKVNAKAAGAQAVPSSQKSAPIQTNRRSERPGHCERTSCDSEKTKQSSSPEKTQNKTNGVWVPANWCNKALFKGLVKEAQTIKHSYCMLLSYFGLLKIVSLQIPLSPTKAGSLKRRRFSYVQSWSRADLQFSRREDLSDSETPRQWHFSSGPSLPVANPSTAIVPASHHGT